MDLHTVGPVKFHKHLGLTQRFTDAREAGLLPYTGVIVRARVDDPDGWLTDDSDAPEGHLPLPVTESLDHDKLALLLFGIDAQRLDLAESGSYFTSQITQVSEQLERTTAQATAWLRQLGAS